MSCAHCCYAYGAGKKGEHMPLQMFKDILDKYNPIIKKRNWYIVLGGGEPTLHPQFMDILGYAMIKGFPWLATNGSQTDIALELCELAKNGKIACALSQDEWHDPIDSIVIEEFSKGLTLYEYGRYNSMFSAEKCGCDRREVRTVKIPYKGGRSNNIPGATPSCPCPGIHFKVNGNIEACGCDESPIIGTVNDGIQDIQYKYYDVFRGCVSEPNAVYYDEVQPLKEKP